MAEHNEFGRQGEQIALEYLIDRGYTILAQNFRYRKAEIDIIAQIGDTLAIVEVKSRTIGFLEEISVAIHPKKVQLLTLAANQFIQDRDLDLEVRFDVIKVIRNHEKLEMEHLENAFYHF